MEAGLKIKIGADIVEVTKSLDRLKSQLKTFEEALAKSTDSKRVDLLNRSIEKTKAIIAGVKGFRVNNNLPQLTDSANQATFAFTNLSRVAQDAPFGFIGIANNIDPLIQSFISLRRESGSLGGTFNSLLTSFLGSGGLVLGFGLLSSALSIFGQRSQSSKKDISDFKDELKSVGDVIGDATSGVQGEIAKVTALSSVITNTNRSYKERKAALESLQKVNKAYFGDLTLEETQLGRVKTATDDYTKSLINTAIIKGVQEEISALAKNIRVTTNEYTELAKRVVLAQQNLRKANENALREGLKGQGTNSAVTQAQIEFDSLRKRLGEAAKKLEEFGVLNKELTAEIQKQVLEQSLLNSNYKEETTNRTNNVKAIKDETEALKQQQLIRGEINNAVKFVGTGPFNTSPGVAAKDISGITGNPLSKFSEDLLKAQEEAKKTARAFTDTLTPAIDSFFSSLLNGSKSPFQAIGDALKQLLAQLAAAVVKALVFRAILTAINPGAAAGQSFGQLFSQFAGFGGGGGVANRINTGGITGSAAQIGGGRIVGELRGSTLALALQRTNKSFGI